MTWAERAPFVMFLLGLLMSNQTSHDDVLLRPAYYIAITSGRERDHSLYQHNQYDCLLFIRTELSMADALHSKAEQLLLVASCYTVTVRAGFRH